MLSGLIPSPESPTKKRRRSERSQQDILDGLSVLKKETTPHPLPILTPFSLPKKNEIKIFMASCVFSSTLSLHHLSLHFFFLPLPPKIIIPQQNIGSASVAFLFLLFFQRLLCALSFLGLDVSFSLTMAAMTIMILMARVFFYYLHFKKILSKKSRAERVPQQKKQNNQILIMRFFFHDNTYHFMPMISKKNWMCIDA